MMLRHTILVSALVLASSTGLLAQVTGGTGSQGSFSVSPFEPSPIDVGLFGGGGGGQFTPPADAGKSTDVPRPTTGGPADIPTSTAAEAVHSSGRTSRASSSANQGVRSSNNSGGAAVIPTVSDSWLTWWETNKFDFITLRRVDDAPMSGQGLLQESAEERAERLARVRAQIRAEVIPILADLTSADDPAVRASAIVSLGKIRADEGVALAREMLQDRSFDVRRAAMLALGVLDAGHASYLLMNIAGDSSLGRKLLNTTNISDDDRGVALLAATLRGDHAAEVLLDRLLEDPDDLPTEVLAVACEAAGLMQSLGSIRPLISVARDEDLPEFVRSSATNALGRIGDPSAVPVLLELLDGGLEPKRAATVALGHVTHPGLEPVVERLIEVLREETDAPSRHFAAISLGRIGGPAARAALESEFHDGRSDMRPWLALGLALCERDTPRGTLPDELSRRIERESNVETVGAYLIALGLCGGTRGLPTLERELLKGRVQVAGHAALALGLTGEPEAVEILLGALDGSQSPVVQKRVALGLGILGDGTATPDLVDLIREAKNQTVASFAAIGVAFMGDENAIGPLLRIIEREGPRGVPTQYATVAVGQLFDADRRPALSRLAAGDNYLARPAAVRNLLSLGF